MINKIKTYITTHKTISIISLIILLALGYFIYNKITNTGGETRYVTAKVEKTNIISSVTGSGQVTALNSIDLKAKISGTVTYIGVKAGDRVTAGQTLFSIDSKDAQKNVRDAEINLASAKLSLEKLKMQNSEENMNADLAKAYDDGFSSVSDTFLDLPSTLTGLNDLFSSKNLTENDARLSGKTAINYLSKSQITYYEAKNAFEKNRENYRKLNHNSSKEDIDTIINETYETTKKVADAVNGFRNYVDFMAEDTDRASDFTQAQNTLSSYTNTINNHLSSLLSIKTSIKNYKDAFPTNNLDIESSLLSIKQKENALQDAKDTLSDYYVRAPFNGTIATVIAKVGDTTSTTLGTIITENKIATITLNEVDAAKIAVGQKATISFDALSDLTITGKIAEVDSVGTVSSGVVTYTIKINFDTQDNRIKPGMSVSTSIISDMKQDVLAISSSAIKTKGPNSYVEIFNIELPSPTTGVQGSISPVLPEQIKVETGISSDTKTEIISGLKEGDIVVIKTIKGTNTSTTSTTTKANAGILGGGKIGGGIPHN